MNRKWMQMIVLLVSISLLTGALIFAGKKNQNHSAHAAHSGSTQAQQGSSSSASSSAGTTNSTGTTAPPTTVTSAPTTASTTASAGSEEEQPEDPCVQLAAEYEAYIALSPEEQQAYFLSFSSYEDFFEWFHTVKDAYEALQDRIEIGGDGNVDIGDLIEGNK